MRTHTGAGVQTGDILQLLKRDHQRVTQLFDFLEATQDEEQDERERGFAQLAGEIESHSQAEDDVFYSMLQDQLDDEEPVEEARQEHEQIDQLLEDMDQMDVLSASWMESLYELRQLFQHHIESEESELFALAREMLDAAELSRLGDAFRRAKEDSAEAASAGVREELEAGAAEEEITGAAPERAEREPESEREPEPEPGSEPVAEEPQGAGAPDTAAAPSSEPAAPADRERDEIERMSKKDLYELARQRKIEGRSAMTKAELVRAIRAAGLH